MIVAVAKQNYDEFYRWELESRKKLKYPPFSHIINLIWSGADPDKIRGHALVIADALKGGRFRENFYAVLGPAPCPLSRIKSRYRWHVTLKGEAVPPMASIVRGVLKKYPAPTGISLFADVDPVTLM